MSETSVNQLPHAEGGTSPPKPTPIRYSFSKIPAYLRERPQWVCWRYEISDKGKWTKVPYQAKRIGSKASSTTTTTWSSFEDAVSAYELSVSKYDGIGYCLAEGEEIVGIDLDHVVTMDVGRKVTAIEQSAQDIIASMKSYAEISVSGHGVHIFVFGVKPGDRCKDGSFEMYSRDRFLTFTGRKLLSAPATIEPRQDEIASLYLKHFPEPKEQPADPIDHRRLSFTDVQVIERAGVSANGAKFTALMSGNTSGYPSSSEADLALCDHLAFWTRKDAEQMDRIFRQSKLMRPKWDTKRGAGTYGSTTIEKAIAGTAERYGAPAEPQKAPAGERRFGNIVLTTMSHDVAKPVPWLWPERIPLGMLTIFAGAPSNAKSYGSLDLAAHISTGSIWPDIGRSAPLGDVILLSAEDHPEYVIKPRLDSLGADCDKVHRLKMVYTEDDKGTRKFSLTTDLRDLESALVATRSKLVIIDPANSYMGGKTDGFKDIEVRAVLDPLKELAEKLNIAIVLIMHVKKGAEDEIIYRIGGSIAFAAVVREIFFFTRDPDDRERFFFTNPKPLQREAPPLSFRFVDDKFTWDRDEIRLTAHEIINAQRQKPGPKQTARKDVRKWLVSFLHDGPRPAKDGWRIAAEMDFSEGTVRRALKDLEIVVEPIREQGSGLFSGHTWTLPDGAPF